MSLLFVDTETSDLPKLDRPLDDPSQPWVVAIAAELTDWSGATLDVLRVRIRADGRKIRAGAEAVHGVSSIAASRTGVPEVAALGVLCHLAAQARYVIGHGIGTDRMVIESVLVRRSKDARLWTRPGLESVDVMRIATPLCRIVPDPPRDDNGFKWPSLDEAGEILLNEPRRTGIHDAWDDCQRGKRIFFELLRRGAVEIASELAA